MTAWITKTGQVEEFSYKWLKQTYIRSILYNSCGDISFFSHMKTITFEIGSLLLGREPVLSFFGDFSHFLNYMIWGMYSWILVLPWRMENRYQVLMNHRFPRGTVQDIGNLPLEMNLKNHILFHFHKRRLAPNPRGKKFLYIIERRFKNGEYVVRSCEGGFSEL